MKKTIFFIIILLLFCQLSFAGITFDKVDDIINCGSPASLDNLSPITVSVWYKHTDAGELNYGSIVHKDTDAVNGRWGFFHDGGAANPETRLAFFVTHDSGDVSRSTGEVSSTGVWENLIVTWDGSTTCTNIHIYVNNSEASYNSCSNGSGARTTDAPYPLYIGNRDRLNGDITINGTLDEVYIWEAVITAQERALLNSRVRRIGLQIQPSNLRGYWALDNVSTGTSADGVTFKDLSGSGNDCTGDDGANNSGLTGLAGVISSYP